MAWIVASLASVISFDSFHDLHALLCRFSALAVPALLLYSPDRVEELKYTQDLTFFLY